jgi:hypothetical protein
MPTAAPRSESTMGAQQASRRDHGLSASHAWPYFAGRKAPLIDDATSSPGTPTSCPQPGLDRRHAILPRKPSANAESASASCRVASGDGSGIFRLCAPVA